jgi:hypothetical protein
MADLTRVISRLAVSLPEKRPDAIFDLLGAVGVGSGLERAEQEIEIARAVAALGLRQVLGRLHRLDGAAGRRTGRRHGLRQRHRRQQPEGCRRGQSKGGESRAHDPNLNSCRAAARWQLQQQVPDERAAKMRPEAI